MADTLTKYFVNNMNYLRYKQDSQFFINIVALHESGWSLQDIADSFEVSKSAVANWEKKGKELGQHMVTVYPPNIPVKPKKPVAASKTPKPEPPSLTLDEQKTILKLAQAASKVSRNTAVDAPSRKAARDLEMRLYFFHHEQGISLSKLAAAAGVTRRAIAQRLEKEVARREEKETPKDVHVNVNFSATS